jgi:peptide/nickel transport system ATP-binding protein/oligopeptide transport system ATP-binding protein
MMLEVKGLCTQFSTEEGKVLAVNGVSLSMEPGEVLGVVGESGSGKSVTSMSILRLIPDPPGRITGGEILWKDGDGPAIDLARAGEKVMQGIRGDRIAMIFQDPMTSLTPYMTIGDQLSEVLEVHRKQGRKEARAASVRMLRDVGIPRAEERMDDYPHQLSGGMRQRVMIAMALLCEPSLLIADEPTTALDVTIQAQILELLRETKDRRARGAPSEVADPKAAPGPGASPRAQAGKSSMAILLITHDLGVIAKLADRVAVMYAGRIVEHAPVIDLFERPRHPYTLGLLRSVPRVTDPLGKRLLPIAGLPPSAAHVPPGCPFHPRCAYALPVCKKEEPGIRAISGDPAKDERGSHWVKCHVEDIPLPPDAGGAR